MHKDVLTYWRDNMKEKRFLSKRKWLNSVESSSYGTIQYGVVATQWDCEKVFTYDTNASLDIRDCSRTVSLDLSYNTPREKKAMVSKLNLIINACYEMKEAMDEADVWAAEQGEGEA